MHSGGGTLSASDASRHAARLVLSGPAGGVIGAAHVARLTGLKDVITYDMGGTSTDVATVIGGKPQWTTTSTIDGLPIGLPMFAINTIGAGGGSIAHVDAGGALRVGPHSAGAVPGPACYGRGGTEPTVTDANVVLGRIVPEHFLGGAMQLDVDVANRAIAALATRLGKSVIEAALGVVRVVEANMAHAVRAVTSRRGHDPRRFTLVSFGGAGGLHACGIADALEIPRVLVPPYCGVLSALGMIVAPPVLDVAQTVLGQDRRLDEAMLHRVLDELERRAADAEGSSEYFADVRFAGQSHELSVGFSHRSIAAIQQAFRQAYEQLYGALPAGREVQVVSLRLRRTGSATDLKLPDLTASADAQLDPARGGPIDLVVNAGEIARCRALARAALINRPSQDGPLLVIDPEATTYVPPQWKLRLQPGGALLLDRERAD
jgi:N-methylhydantoinase A